MVFGKVQCREHVPVIFNFRTFGNAESQTGKDINDFVLYNGERVACTEFHRISRTRQIQSVTIVVLTFKHFFQRVDFVLRFCFQFIQSHADFFFLFGSYVTEIRHQIVNGSLLTQVFDAESFEFFGIGGVQNFYLFQKLFNLSYHIFDVLLFSFLVKTVQRYNFITNHRNNLYLCCRYVPKIRQLMKKIVFCLLLLTFSFRLAAQIDYLEPVKPFSTYTGELGEYYRSVFSLLNTGFQKQPYARFAAIPSFSPEYAMSVEKRNGRYTLVSNTLSRTYWQAEKGTVTVDTKSVVISASLYQSLGAIFRLVTEQVQDLDGSTAGLDGIVYFFSSTDAKGKEQMGRKWSPEKGTLMERLVLVCQSAYMLSRGENISEQTLAVEAAALLKALQQRTKEEPDAYKRPMYIGIYPVGPRSKTLSGRQVEEPAHFSAMTPEEYIASEMVYPSGLLEKNVSGYALCEFTIDKEGVILRPHILRSTHPEFAEEALRIVKGMPKWSPALVGGKPADSNYTLYVPFRPQLYRNK